MTNLGKDGSVEFRFFRPAASDVRLVGDFDAWAGQGMHRDVNGWWTAVLQLSPGEYRFRYVADGQWFTDFASNGVEVTTLGWNSVLVIPTAKSAPPQKTQARGALKVA
jgi:1,4-alpha-glucan branching enzyme